MRVLVVSGDGVGLQRGGWVECVSCSPVVRFYVVLLCCVLGVGFRLELSPASHIGLSSMMAVILQSLWCEWGLWPLSMEVVHARTCVFIR
jgi:hypothetical protein